MSPLSVATEPQTGRPGASSRAEQTREAIVRKAEELFRTMGYQKTAVADIARELGMSPANVYRFFPSKAAINEAICARILGAYAEVMWAVARGAGTPEARLQSLFRTAQEQTMLLFFQEKRLHDMVEAAMDEHWSVIEGFIQTVEGAIRHVIMDGQAAGVFARAEPDRLAKLVHMSMVGFVHPTVVKQCAGTEDLKALAEEMAAFALRALRV